MFDAFHKRKFMRLAWRFLWLQILIIKKQRNPTAGIFHTAPNNKKCFLISSTSVPACRKWAQPTRETSVTDIMWRHKSASTLRCYKYCIWCGTRYCSSTFSWKTRIDTTLWVLQFLHKQPHNCFKQKLKRIPDNTYLPPDCVGSVILQLEGGKKLDPGVTAGVLLYAGKDSASFTLVSFILGIECSAKPSPARSRAKGSWLTPLLPHIIEAAAIDASPPVNHPSKSDNTGSFATVTVSLQQFRPR